MKITKQQLKQIISEEFEKTLNEDESDHLNLKGMGDALSGAAVLPKRYPREAAELERRGLTDRYLAAAKAADKKEGKLLHPGQYLKQPDELDAYLGLSQKATAAAAQITEHVTHQNNPSAPRRSAGAQIGCIKEQCLPSHSCQYLPRRKRKEFALRTKLSLES